MNVIKKLTDFVREIANIDAHIDTDAAERSIRNNIEFKGPNAWILAVAIIIASAFAGHNRQKNELPLIISRYIKKSNTIIKYSVTKK